MTHTTPPRFLRPGRSRARCDAAGRGALALALALTLVAAFALTAPPAGAQAPAPGTTGASDTSGAAQPAEAPLPGRGVVVNIDSPERALYRIAVPDLAGQPSASADDGAPVLLSDFTLVGLFDVIDPRSYLNDPADGPLGVTRLPWSQIGAQGVVKGRVRPVGAELAVELRFYDLARGTAPVVSRHYQGSARALRGFMHAFASDVVKALTGEAAPFGTKLAFSRRLGPGEKAVYTADFDGHGLERISHEGGINMLPAFGPGGIWFSHLTKTGMFVTRAGLRGRPVLSGGGMTMGAIFCDGRVFFTSTRDGNSEIYSALPDGSDVRRLTNSPGIDVSPACGPKGRIAFVSTRHGSPQIFIMQPDGTNVQRVTYRGSYNQTPVFCPDPKRSLIAFTGRDETMDIFTVDLETQQYTRITQGQGSNKDPAFSPDCRMIAFYSTRGGIYIASPDGMSQHLVLKGPAETLRWSH